MGLALATLTPGGTAPDAPGSDKLHHAVAFAIMMLPLISVRPSSALWLVPLAALYGGLIEYIQPLVHRSGDIRDLVADLVGIGVGVAAGCLVNRLWKAGNIRHLRRRRSGGLLDEKACCLAFTDRDGNERSYRAR